MYYGKVIIILEKVFGEESNSVGFHLYTRQACTDDRLRTFYILSKKNDVHDCFFVGIFVRNAFKFHHKHASYCFVIHEIGFGNNTNDCKVTPIAAH